MTNIEWNKIVETPLDFALARLKAPKVTDLNAADQIISALHESVHIVYAIDHGGVVESIQVATLTRGGNPKGRMCDDIYQNTIASIENYTAAALFEYSLDLRKDNVLASLEEELALASIHKYRDTFGSEPSMRFSTDIGLLDTTLEKLYPHDIQSKWPVIETVAKAILIHRDSKTGKVPDSKEKPIVRSINKYVREYLNEQLTDPHYYGDFERTISWLSPFAKTINQRDENKRAKWMRENDLDTILEIIKKKYP